VDASEVSRGAASSHASLPPPTLLSPDLLPNHPPIDMLGKNDNELPPAVAPACECMIMGSVCGEAGE